MATAANIAKSGEKRYRICKLRLPIRITSLYFIKCTSRHSFFILSFLTAHTVPTCCFFLYIMVLNVLFTTGLAKIYRAVPIKNLSRICKNGSKTK